MINFTVYNRFTVHILIGLQNYCLQYFKLSDIYLFFAVKCTCTCMYYVNDKIFQAKSL